MAYFPTYFKKVGEKMVAISEEEVPEETHLKSQKFAAAEKGSAYTSQAGNETIWSKPGSKSGPFKVSLSDGSVVTYSWYRFIDQPSIVSLNLSEEDKNRIQKNVERIHENWTSDKEYMAPPSQGKLVTLDNAIIVIPPKGMEKGYVPIVTRQEQGE